MHRESARVDITYHVIPAKTSGIKALPLAQYSTNTETTYTILNFNGRLHNERGFFGMSGQVVDHGRHSSPSRSGHSEPLKRVSIRSRNIELY